MDRPHHLESDPCASVAMDTGPLSVAGGIFFAIVSLPGRFVSLASIRRIQEAPILARIARWYVVQSTALRRTPTARPNAAESSVASATSRLSPERIRKPLAGERNSTTRSMFTIVTIRSFSLEVPLYRKIVLSFTSIGSSQVTESAEEERERNTGLLHAR
jgi:hypothetical protein